MLYVSKEQASFTNMHHCMKQLPKLITYCEVFYLLYIKTDINLLKHFCFWRTPKRRANYHSCFASTILMGWYRQSKTFEFSFHLSSLSKTPLSSSLVVSHSFYLSRICFSFCCLCHCTNFIIPIFIVLSA